MNYLPHSEASMEHYNDLRREADHARLVREVRKANGKDKPFYHSVLVWLQCRFIALRQKLSRSNQRAVPVRALTEPSISPCQN